MTVDPRNAMLVGLRVLVVEDDAAIGTQLARGLARAGCRPTVVQRAADSLGADAALVLLDLGLPDMDGVELCRRLRQRSRCRSSW